MTVDEWALRDTARDLANLYRELDQAKYQPMQSRGERVMKPRPGPRVPGNWFMIALDADLVDHLVEMICDARNHIEPGYTVGRDGRVLCEWVAWNANAISELDFAEDLHDLMTDQARKIHRRLHPAGIDQVAARPEQPQSAKSILIKLRSKGHQVQARNLHDWTARGHITAYPNGDGTNRYLMSEVLDYLAQRNTA